MKEIGQGIDGIYRWLKDQGFPEGFRVLCHNCNQGRESNGGICPHREMMTSLLQSTHLA